MTDPVFIHPLPQDCGAGSAFALTGAEARHTEVKRMRDGEPLVVTDGVGSAIRGHWSAGQVVVDEQLGVTRQVPRVTVVQAIPKSDRAELAVDLMSQAGADRIIPWAASRSIAKWDGKEERARMKWENAARSAAKQSRRLLLPEVTELLRHPQDLGSFFDANPASSAPKILILHESATQGIQAVDFSGVEDVVLVVGPEGGVSEDELEQFAALGAQPIRLGPEVLRTATAASVALGALGVLTARWGNETGKATIG